MFVNATSPSPEYKFERAVCLLRGVQATPIAGATLPKNESVLYNQFSNGLVVSTPYKLGSFVHVAQENRNGQVRGGHGMKRT